MGDRSRRRFYPSPTPPSNMQPFDYKAFDPPFFPEDERQKYIGPFHSIFCSIAGKMKRFYADDMRMELDRRNEWRRFGVKRIPEDFGYSSIEHFLFFRGCVQEGRHFTFDSNIAQQRKAAIVAAHLGQFTQKEFRMTFYDFFRCKGIFKGGRYTASSLDKLLKSLPDMEAVNNDEGTFFHGDRNRESQKSSEIQKQKIPVPSDVVERNSSDSDIEILHERIVTKKRPLAADEEEATFDGDGEPDVKKKKKSSEQPSPRPSESFVDEESNGDSNVLGPDEDILSKKREEIKTAMVETMPNHNSEGLEEHKNSSIENINSASEEADAVDEEENEEEVEATEESGANEEDVSTVKYPIPMDPSEAIPLYGRILNMGIPRGELVEKQLSEITTEIDPSIQNEGAIGGTGDPRAGCSHSQSSEAAPADSGHEALSGLMSRYSDEFLNAVVTGAMKNGMEPKELGKKVLDLEKLPDHVSGGKGEEIETKVDSGDDSSTKTLESSIPPDPSVNPSKLLFDHILNLDVVSGKWAEHQLSLITAEMEQKGEIGGTDDPDQNGDSVSFESAHQALSELMSRFHNDFVNAMVIGAMEKGVYAKELGKKFLRCFLEKNPEP